MNRQQTILLVHCRCGGAATPPTYSRKGHQYQVTCSKPSCPAIVVRQTAAKAVEAWNEMSTTINP